MLLKSKEGYEVKADEGVIIFKINYQILNKSMEKKITISLEQVEVIMIKEKGIDSE